MKKLYHILVFLTIANFASGQVSGVYATKNTDFTIATNGIYKVINSADSQATTDQVGAPQLPVIVRKFDLPAGSIVTNLSVSNGSKIQMGSGNMLLYPTQPPCALNGKPCPDFVGPDPAIYDSNTPFPKQTATISNDASPVGYHVVLMQSDNFYRQYWGSI